MFFVDQSDVDTFFHLATGEENPYWSVTSDSDALRLGASTECTDIACKIDQNAVAKIRSMTSEPQEVSCVLSLYGQQINVVLTGRRISDNKWRGIASARSLPQMKSMRMDEAGEHAYYGTR